MSQKKLLIRSIVISIILIMSLSADCMAGVVTDSKIVQVSLEACGVVSSTRSSTEESLSSDSFTGRNEKHEAPNGNGTSENVVNGESEIEADTVQPDESETGTQAPPQEMEGESPGESSGGAVTEGEPSPEEAQALNQTLEQTVVSYNTDEGYEYTAYINDRNNDRKITCLLFVPYGEQIEEFMEETEWSFFSALDKFNVICLSYDWEGNPDEAQLYTDSVYSDISQSWLDSDSEVFLIGYENASDFAEEEAIKHSDRYVGAILIGTDGLSSDTLAQYNANDVKPLSLWLVAESRSVDLKDSISFWKKANSIADADYTSYYISYADGLYLPSCSSADSAVGSDSMGAIYVNYDSNYRESSIAGSICRNFIGQIKSDEISFRGNIAGGEIFSFNDWHFTYYRTQYEGLQRDYWLYIPDGQVLGSGASSVILCLHGSGGNGEDMIFRANWQSVADKNNCIVIYPSSLYVAGKQHYWLNIDKETDYLAHLVEEVCEKYNVDRSRIYVTGFSNGSGMAQAMAVKYSDIFAAAALGAPAYFDEEYADLPTDSYNVAVLFSYGTEDKYLKEFNITADIDDNAAVSHLKYWRSKYGFSQDDYTSETDGKYTTYTFCTKYDIPVCEWIVVEGKKHEYPREEVPIYYEFLSAYTKDEDGNLYYNGQLVLAE